MLFSSCDGKGYHKLVPFLIHSFKNTHTRIIVLEDKLKPKDVHATANKDENAPYDSLSGFDGCILILDNGPGMFSVLENDIKYDPKMANTWLSHA
jgi:hypothetical protein